MPAPSSNLDWTVGNPNFGTVTVEPTTGKKLTGWTPGEAPPIQVMNWLFYQTDQWIKYLNSQVGAGVTNLAALQAQVDTIQNSLFSTNMVQEVPSGTADGSNALFTISQVPSNPANTFVFANSLLVPKAEYSIAGKNITFGGGYVPAAGTDILVIYVIQTGFSGQTVSTGPSGQTSRVETRVVTSGEISAQQLTLAAAPFDGTQVLIDVIEDGPQAYGIDFTVSGNVVQWAGLDLGPAISAGSVLRIQYFV
jgi:hypothetical protein